MITSLRRPTSATKRHRTSNFAREPRQTLEFRARIRNERARSDRNGVPFSMLALELPATTPGQSRHAIRARREVQDALRDELGEIDEWGWLGPRQLALLMTCTTFAGAASRAERVSQRLEKLPVHARSSLATYPYVGADDEDFDHHASWAEILYREPPHWKRTMDVLGALCGMLLLSPLFIVIAVTIKLVSRGPVFFRQQRAGAKGRPFWMMKFRTMCVSVDSSIHQAHISQQMQSNGTMSKIDDEQRLIPFGKPLRELGLDELPQLINVLRGEMSLVGPRPDVVPFESYSHWQRRRFDVLPGITGWWQVNGKNDTTFQEMMRMDAQYVDNRSFWFDLRILLSTIPAVWKLSRQE